LKRNYIWGYANKKDDLIPLDWSIGWMLEESWFCPPEGTDLSLVWGSRARTANELVGRFPGGAGRDMMWVMELEPRLQRNQQRGCRRSERKQLGLILRQEHVASAV
jgi:hypothetical protein